MMRTPLRLRILSAATLIAAACSTTTMVQTWTAPGFSKTTVKKILVLGVTPNPLLRRLYEDSFAVELEKLGYKAVSGYLWAPDATNLDKDAIIARMKAENVTNVIVTRIIGKKELVTYSAPTVSVGVGYGGYGGYGGFGPAYYGSWSTYYSTSYAAVSDPGYMTVNDVVTLQTNFYDASREPDALVWSGESDTTLDQTRSGKQVPGVINAVVYQMRASRVL
jgi:hypothetical protein